jgi:hypothetical protein
VAKGGALDLSNLIATLKALRSLSHDAVKLKFTRLTTPICRVNMLRLRKGPTRRSCPEAFWQTTVQQKEKCGRQMDGLEDQSACKVPPSARSEFGQLQRVR